MSLLKDSGVTGGLVVVLGVETASTLAAFDISDSVMVHGLVWDQKRIPDLRRELDGSGQYGKITVDCQRTRLLPFIDNLVNLLVVLDQGDIPTEELNRVLVPNGVAVSLKSSGRQTFLKGRSKDLDDWTHYFYDAKGNAVSHDDVVAPPERLQWLGSPRWSRHHDRMSSLSAMVSNQGRLFYIMDEGSRVSILLPSKWSLIARDAFNGVVLWKKPIEYWHSQMWPLKSGPTQLARRLVAVGDSVYVTLSVDAPVTRLKAANGEIEKVFEGTRGTEEILLAHGRMFALINPEPWVLTDFAPQYNTGDQRRVETEFNWDRKPRELQVLDPDTGELLWATKGLIAPITLAADENRVVFYNGDRVVAHDFQTGRKIWESDSLAQRSLFEYNYAPRLLLHGDMVLYAGGDGAMKGINARDGKEIWSAPHNKSGYRSPEDLMVAGGLVWNAPTLSGNMSGAFTGRDPFTGAVKKEFPPDIETYWFHHRCYIAKATDRYLIPSRTGIEFVDFNQEHWDINHWVRGACLYGVLPCNGLVYAPPHNCACYPEAKLFGFNALAPGSASPHPKHPDDSSRLEKGAAYMEPISEEDADSNDWPTYRHDNQRSGSTNQELVNDLTQAWEITLGGRLSAPVIAAGKCFVAQVDQHQVHAMDADTGKPLWNYIAGGRIDSPPTYWKGRVLFGSADGWVYCLRASDGALIWRFQAAPGDRRLMALEALESVWPVHGSVLVENDLVSFVAGRSVFLDGGMRFLRLDAATGLKRVETVLDDRDPETGGDLQDRIQTLQMPVGLNDILSSDGEFTYLRSQKFTPDGARVDLGPVSGNAAVQGGTQSGKGAHIFAPMGFLDDSWFHRSYWVYGKNFAGGHNGYHQAGKYAPAGRILVFDDENVYGYGREAKYYKWTTTMEHQLFSASRDIPEVDPAASNRGGALAGVKFPQTKSIDPAGKELTVEVWILPDGNNGVIISHGGPAQGYALTLNKRKPAFYIRSASQLFKVESPDPIDKSWHHLVGVLDAEKQMKLYLDGRLVAEAEGVPAIAAVPAQGLELGSDSGSQVGDYAEFYPFKGLMDHFAIYHRALSDQTIRNRATPGNGVDAEEDPVVFCSFDRGDARDESGNNVHGVLSGVDTGKGRSGAALWFRTAGNARSLVASGSGKPAPNKDGSFVEHHWQQFVPMFARAMTKAGNTMFIAGPPDLVDEEEAFEKLTRRDSQILKELEKQDAALMGKFGAKLSLISISDGQVIRGVDLDSPPVWDGMAVAQGRIYVATEDGKVLCFGKPYLAMLSL